VTAPTRPAGMRYARAAPPPPAGREVPAAAGSDATGPRAGATGRTPSGRPSRRRPAVLAAAALVAGGGVAVGLAVSGGPGTAVERTPAAEVVARAFVQASVLAESPGAPAAFLPARPPGPSDRRPCRAAAGHLRPARAEHRWRSPGGNVSPLTPLGARRLLLAQRAEVRALLSGAARREQLGELASVVAGERRSRPAPVSPGGARVTTW
jgi:hypothetical protein